MFRLAWILLLLLLTYQLVTQAKVASSIVARGEDSSTSQRSIFSIVWGCISTTLICAWATIHPNMPPREGPVKKTLRRLELMFWTIVAPEFIPCWALKQLLAAMTVRDVYNKAKGHDKKKCGIWESVKGWISLYEITEAASPAWTVPHGHFLIMGGFHVVEPSTEMDVPPEWARLVEESDMDTEEGHGPEKKAQVGTGTILTLAMLEELVKDPEFEIQTTEEEITDKSKGDALSKLIFILQSTWFILQCVGRRAQGLDMTQLELTTLALASLNGITFGLWWDKPLGAQVVVRVYLKRKLKYKGRNFFSPYKSNRFVGISRIKGWFESRVTFIRDTFRFQSKGNVFVDWLVELPLSILFLLLLPIVAFTFVFFATLLDVTRISSSPLSPDHTHVPTFYVPVHRFHKWYHVPFFLTLGAIFGGIHCFGWHFPFPTLTEQKLWRVASLAVTIFPVSTFPLLFFVFSHNLLFSSVRVVVRTLLLWIIPLFGLAYVVARIVLIGLSLAQLRHLPPTAFIAVNWTKFYPHML